MSSTPNKRKLEEIVDLNDGFCQTPPPSAKKPRKTFTLEYKLKMVEASKNHEESQRKFAASHNLDEALLRIWKKNEGKIRSSLEKKNGTTLRVVGGGKKTSLT